MPSNSAQIPVQQVLIGVPSPSISTQDCTLDELHRNGALILKNFAATCYGFVGVAALYGSRAVLSRLVLTSHTQALAIQFPKRSGGQKQPSAGQSGLNSLTEHILVNPHLQKLAFHMDRIVISLHLDAECHTANAIDILSLTSATRASLDSYMKVLGGAGKASREQVKEMLKEGGSMGDMLQRKVTEAWLARCVALHSFASRVNAAPQIDTRELSLVELRMLSAVHRDGQRLFDLKPTHMMHEVSIETSAKGVNTISQRFKTRLMRPTSHQAIHLQTTVKGKKVDIPAQLKNLDGKNATFELGKEHLGSSFRSLTTTGKEDPSAPEARRASAILKALQNEAGRIIFQSYFIRRLWSTSLCDDAPAFLSQNGPQIRPISRPLNQSQEKAVTAILSPSRRMEIIHGPPGTGKTTVIAVAVQSLIAGDATRTVYLVAQSNVAVLNIAKKLYDINFKAFKILVSKDFHYDWHEHLYQDIENHLIRSETFREKDLHRRILNTRVILCTLSMLSNKEVSKITHMVPVELIIADEASQIEIGDYLPTFSRFLATLRKVVFIGDDKQLPPYGQSDIDTLKSVFEIKEIRKSAIALDTQYRLPIPVGTFISNKVYGGNLRSVHDITVATCCRFIDIASGKEEKKGGSFVNRQEIKAVIQEARKLELAGKKYRIITPYDAQRSELESAMKGAGLRWQDKCFNVDSFQGNEDDHIIISVVRTKKIGFLREPRRTNVMLTRCKKSMIIVTHRLFLQTTAAKSLVGKLSVHLGNECWR